MLSCALSAFSASRGIRSLPRQYCLTDREKVGLKSSFPRFSTKRNDFEVNFYRSHFTTTFTIINIGNTCICALLWPFNFQFTIVKSFSEHFFHQGPCLSTDSIKSEKSDSNESLI